MKARRGFLKALCILSALPLFAACAQTGDFGRSVPMPYVTTLASATNGEQFRQTDEEHEMRARIHRFMTLPRAEPWLVRFFEVAPTEGVNVNGYYQGLKSQGFASSRGPYNRLRTDIQVDLAALPAVFGAICRVQEIDRRRQLALDNLVNVEPELYATATARLQANRETIAQFSQALDFRYASYVFALEHLIIETPHAQARTVDAELSGLATANGAAQANDFCANPSVSSLGAPARLGAI